MNTRITHTQTLLQALQALLPECSNNSLRQFIQDGRVLVDGAVAKRLNVTLIPGQTVSFSERRVKYELDLKIVYEDKHLVVIEKPSGLLSVRTAYETEQTAHNILKDRYRAKVFVVHRLDFETSGLMIFARTEEAFYPLKEELFQRHVKRDYIAVVEGHLEGAGTWECHLYEDKAHNMHVRPDGELAITHYKVLSHTNGFTRLSCSLETGKKHQIRIHAREAGHPVAGDARYGATTNPFDRLALHAEKLTFCHPITRKTLSFSSPAPF